MPIVRAYEYLSVLDLVPDYRVLNMATTEEKGSDLLFVR